jgi:hypothetical protein
MYTEETVNPHINMYTEETVNPHKYVHYEETVNLRGNTGIYTEETNNCYPWNMFTRKKPSIITEICK